MVATCGGDYVSLPSAHTGEFYGAFNSLGPRSTQEEAIQPGRGDGGELGEQRGTAVIVEQLWAGNQRFRLLGHCFSDHGMRVPQTRHTHAGGTIDVLLALVIP